MKKWKLIRIVTIIMLILFLGYIIFDAIQCINMKYTHPMLGIDANNWLDQFSMDLIFIMLIWGIPLIIDITFLVLSIIKTKNKLGSDNNE